MSTPTGHTKMFTLTNTEGFTQCDLDLLNEAAAYLTAGGMEMQSACDLVNNNWLGDGSDDVNSLIAWGD